LRTRNNFFGSNLFERFALVRFSLLALLTVVLLGGASAVQTESITGASEASGFTDTGAINGIVIEPDTGVKLYSANAKDFLEGKNLNAWIIECSTDSVVGTGTVGSDLADFGSNGVSLEKGVTYEVLTEDTAREPEGNYPEDLNGITVLGSVYKSSSSSCTPSNHQSNSYNRNVWEFTFSTNTAPQFNSTSISPDPPLIGENVSYSAEVYDSDGSVDYTNLSLSYGGSTVVSDEQRTGTTSPVWNNVYTPQDGNKWLNATLEVGDDAGAVTTTEINRYLSNDAPNVNISAPIDQELYGSQSRNYEAEIISSTDSKPDENISYTINLNGQQVEQASNTGDFNISGNVNAQEGSNTLEVIADDGVNQASKSVSFEVDTTSPTIDILSPESFEPDRTDITLEANVSDPNLDNCFYNIDGGINQSLPICDTAQLSINSIGDYQVNVYAEDTVGNTGSESKTFTADYVNEIRLEDSVSSSSILEFQVGFKSNGSQVGAGGSTTNGEFLFNTSDLPSGEVNATFTASGYKTKTEPFQVDDSFTLNQTFGMERAGIFIEAFEENSQDRIDFDLTALNDAGTTYSEENITSFDYDYEGLPSGFPEGEVTLTIDDAKSNYGTEAEYDQFRPRKYIVTVDENTKTSLKSYLLERGAGIFVTVQVSDGEGERLPGALVNIQRNLGNNYQTVSSKRTATDGTASYYLDPDVTYQALVSKSGYSSFKGTFSPVNYQAEALQIALGTESNFTRSNTWDSIEYDLTPQSSRLNLTGVQSFNFSATDTESGLEEVGVRLYNQTGSKVKENSVTGSPSGMSSQIDVNLSTLDLEQGDRLRAVGFFVKEGDIFKVQRTYTTRKHIIPGLSSLVTLFDNADGLGDGTKGMVALLISIVAGAGLKSEINKKGAGMITLGVLGIFVMVGWFNSFFFLLTLFMLVGLYGTR